MEESHGPVEVVTPSDPTKTMDIRVRNVNWRKILSILDETPGQWFLIGELDQSVRTHIRKGRYKYIDPTKYECVTRRIEGGKSYRANIHMRRIPDA